MPQPNSSDAMRWVWAVVLLYTKQPVSVAMATYSSMAISGVTARQLSDDAVEDLAAGGGVRVQTHLLRKEPVGAMVIDGQLDAVRVGGRVVRQQVQRRDVGGHYVLRCKALPAPSRGAAQGA